MLYRIGEISKLLGITAESIRYYERQGVVCSKYVDPENGYRYYSALDVYVLMRVRMYRNCGFSLQEAAALVNDCSMEALAAELAAKQADMRAAIEWNERLLVVTAGMADTYRSIEAAVGACRVENSPAMYRFPFSTDELLTADVATMRQVTKWVEKMPLVALTPYFAKEDILAGSDRHGIGMCVLEEVADYVDVSGAEIELEYLPSRPCVYTALCVEQGMPLHCNMLAHVLAYMEENGMALDGDAIGKTTTTVFHSTVHRRFHEVWLPFRMIDPKH